MNNLYLTRNQALNLASALEEYTEMHDSSERFVFKGFQISFGDALKTEMQAGDSVEVVPIPDFLDVNDEIK